MSFLIPVLSRNWNRLGIVIQDRDWKVMNFSLLLISEPFC